jgi:hypothetical protein
MTPDARNRRDGRQSPTRTSNDSRKMHFCIQKADMNTPPSPPLSSTAVEFLRWAADDFVEAFCLRDVVRRLVGILTPEAEREAGLAVLQELFAAELLRVGEMQADTEGLVYWEGPWPDLIGRVEAAWSVKHPPEMGQPPWFSASEKGKRMAEGRQ